jgi:uncharacterized membrane protein YeaQ/YmgE (transglycosylase-associated protein family)
MVMLLRSILKSIIIVVLTMLIGFSAVFGYVAEKLMNAQPPTGTITGSIILVIGTNIVHTLIRKEKDI